MNTEEHLKRIKEKCSELLALAKNRTPGEWKYNNGRRMLISVDSLHEDAVLYGDEFEISDSDAAYIVSCAGPAEAGWGDTIAAIDAINYYRKVKFAWDGDCGADEIIAELEDSVLARWPEELL